MATNVSRARLDDLLERERGRYAEQHARSRAAFADAQEHLFGGVPMTWMAKWAGGFPMYLAEAHGNRVTDVDGNTYVDFCLGDTGAMAGHAGASRSSGGSRPCCPPRTPPGWARSWLGASVSRAGASH
jgi:glutamate-1-semialdehyde 2,1-aminomutase